MFVLFTFLTHRFLPKYDVRMQLLMFQIKMLRGRFDAYVLVFIHLGCRRVYLSQPTFHPDEAWVIQQARNMGMWLDGKGIESDGPLSTKQRLTIQKAFKDFWQAGGFPGVNRLGQQQRIETHQANWDTILASIIGPTTFPTPGR